MWFDHTEKWLNILISSPKPDEVMRRNFPSMVAAPDLVSDLDEMNKDKCTHGSQLSAI